MANVSRFTIRTSGRRTMRRCLRKWGFQSSMKLNLQRKGTETNINFWFGSGIHFAMEDFFGYNRFGDPVRAFQAYYAAFPSAERPNGADEHYYLGIGMLEYFKEWYPKHNEAYGFQTVWLNENNEEVEPGTPGARPLVEESFILNLGRDVWVREDTWEIIDPHAQKFLRDEETGKLYLPFAAMPGELCFETQKVWVSKQPVYYHGTLDRVVRDKLGRWWIMDWKTAKSADTNKLDTDDQISAYLWAAEQWFGRPIYGFMYVQMTKEVPKPPRMLDRGGISTDKKQHTSYALAKELVIKTYGSVQRAPKKVVEYLNYLISLETPEGDRYIRWDAVKRSKEQKISTYQNIQGELDLMTNPNLYLFPNFTRDCAWDCQFREVCMLMEEQKHEEAERVLYSEFEPRPREEDGNIDAWRQNIPWPDTDKYAAVTTLVKEMELTADEALSIILPDQYKELQEE